MVFAGFEGQSAMYVKKYLFVLIVTTSFLVLIQALSMLKLKSASVMTWLTKILCSKNVGGDAVLVRRARR